MKKVFYVFILLITPCIVFAKGKAQDDGVYLNDTWILCVTDFDVSSLPMTQQVVGHLVAQHIVMNMLPMEEKLRTTAEYNYYLAKADLDAQKAAAAKIAEKQMERDKQVFLGLSDIQYKAAIKRIDSELEVLHQTYKQTVLVPPKIALSPTFSMNEDTTNNLFPSPPEVGSEASFCSTQKVDGFVKGKITEYYGRFYVQVALWTLYSRKYVYSDSVIFSVNDLNVAVKELTDRLENEIAGMQSAGIRIHAVPENAVIVVGEFFGGRGDVEFSNFTPGDVEISVYADKYITTTATINLKEDELADVTVELVPEETSNFSIEAEGLPPEEKALVYDGALYIGEAPIALSGPTDKFKQFNLITDTNKTAQTVFKIADGNIKLKLKPEPAEGRTEKARKAFYGAYGRFWISLPFFILTNSLAESLLNDAKIHNSQEIFDKYLTMHWVRVGTGVVAAGFLAETLVRIFIYVYQANKPTNPIAKKIKPLKAEPEPEEMPEEVPEAETQSEPTEAE
ncbi:MAG: hypothetical protein Ta2G_14440 [Termitinemataceae bacterium]|nr:MAG: hypothetical protein Ta2G_14440 [Termitinemataceae bacterium]